MKTTDDFSTGYRQLNSPHFLDLSFSLNMDQGTSLQRWSVIHQRHLATSDAKNKIFKIFKISKKYLFPRQEINLNGGMILKLLSNTGIGLMILQNGISAFEKALLSKNTWYQRFELERTFQNPNEHHFVPRMNAQIVRAINNSL